MGISPDDWFACVHVRESGFRNDIGRREYRNAKIANYQKRGNIKYNQYKLLKKISLSFSDQRKIFKY